MVPVTRTGSGARDMAAIMERVRKMSDSQLADILAGKDVSIPQFAAMTEAMGRKQLRQAVDGAQAQQQAQQPSIKEQLLAEQQAPAGLDQLPAPNMEAMGEGMAAGGIIAFSGKEGSLVEMSDEDYLKATNPEAYARQKRQADAWKRVADDKKPYSVAEFRQDVVDPLKSFFTAPFDKAAAAKAEKAELAKIMREKNVSAEEAVQLRGIQKQIGDQEGDFPMYTPIAPRANAAVNPPAAANPNATNPNVANPNAAPPSGIAALNAAEKFERRANPFAGMAAEQQDYEKLKSQGLGEGLMKMGAGLLSAPGSKGFAAGIQALAESGALSRKEIAGLKKDARDYGLNLKKAESAFEQGNDELALKYTEAANLNKYRMDSLNQKPGELRTLEAIMANPKLAALYKGGKGTGVVSRTDALKEWNDLPPGDKRKLQGMGVSDFNSYYSYLSTGLPGLQVVDTLGEGAKIRN